MSPRSGLSGQPRSETGKYGMEERKRDSVSQRQADKKITDGVVEAYKIQGEMMRRQGNAVLERCLLAN